MSKILLVGDPHVTHDDLEDCQKLFDIINKATKENVVEHVFFLGDMHHRHSSVRTEEMAFVKANLKRIVEDNPTVTIHILLGNHDMPTSCDRKHNSLWPYESERVKIYDEPTYLSKLHNQTQYPFFAIPYCHSAEEWDKQISQIPFSEAVVFAHQSFMGFSYENGFPIKEGFTAPEGIQIYSGHIHSPQNHKNIFYTGSPRWRTIGDSDVEQRHLHILEIKNNKTTITKKIPTHNEDGVRRIMRVKYEYPQTLEMAPAKNVVLHVEITGPKDWLKEEAKKWQGKAKVKTNQIAQTSSHQIRESQGVGTAFGQYLKHHLSQAQNPPPNEWVNQQLAQYGLPLI